MTTGNLCNSLRAGCGVKIKKMSKRKMPGVKKVITLISLFILSLGSFALAIDLPYMDIAKIRLSIPASGQDSGEIILTNPGPAPRAMRIYLEDWHYVPDWDGTKAFVPANTTSHSCASWISFSPKEFTISPYGKQRINYTVKAPEKAEGGYYAVLFFETVVAGGTAVTDKEIGAGMNINVRIGSIFYVEIQNTVIRRAVIDNLKLRKESSPDRLYLSADFHNTGNVDITAGGTFHIMDRIGKVYARGDFNNVYTLGGDSAQFNAMWDTFKGPIPAGTYDLIVTINLGKALEEAGMGRGPVITKEAEVDFGNNGKVARVGNLK
jgi:hypothetical protein